MNSMRSTVISILLAILLAGCNSDKRLIKEALIGTWVINEAYDYEGIFYPNPNMITFKKKDIGAWPFFESLNFSWSVVNSDTLGPTISIETEHIGFDFEIMFVDNSEQGLLNLQLYSQYYELHCSKMGYDYRANRSKTEKLIKLNK